MKTIVMATLVLAAGLMPAQSQDQGSDIQELRDELQRLRQQVSQLDCNKEVQSQSAPRPQTTDVNATAQPKLVWMKESQAKALELWKDANGNTPRIPIAESTVQAASALTLPTVTMAPSTQCAPVVQSCCPAPASVVVPSTSILGMDSNPYLQRRRAYYRSVWVANSARQAYQTVTYRGGRAFTTPNIANPYVMYPWQARWSMR